MNAPLASSFDRLEQQRTYFSAWVANAPAAAQYRQPGSNQWSAAQVLFHLALVDQQVVTALEKRIASGKPLRPLRFKAKVRAFLLKWALRLPIKFKAPPAVREVPDTVNVSEVVQEWQTTRSRLQALLEAYPAQELDKEAFFHPRAGMLSLPQTLQFLEDHTEHHRRQMQRLLP
ncbi:DinB family protein [Rufibacter glacialis]|uniref:DinB family protein n=1 Tax=Rufibacter glacialis TaxID=1259555 RepID=A0A5M8QJW8_9BACT|nr:DinB family protein [Rufibacter glacialis]KAA6434612.1 DinB family protein [Rufibacter glacialis]GGK70941.1 hypothetical protein GCM10011405_18970 [Rufibacter glacialis]